ncbi:hypothetical protein C8F04DRAFT_1177962 [Mycena alexandri]|uniref:Uncharacterized protein n=1 Tax=Mycena alexandri TaxID=1745969 RepID=A0AAD6X9S5_9AGAR|nr:hypothetical protein C8F04DRAFT_1177962 [Mycena alexandri]
MNDEVSPGVAWRWLKAILHPLIYRYAMPPFRILRWKADDYIISQPKLHVQRTEDANAIKCIERLLQDLVAHYDIDNLKELALDVKNSEASTFLLIQSAIRDTHIDACLNILQHISEFSTPVDTAPDDETVRVTNKLRSTWYHSNAPVDARNVGVQPALTIQCAAAACSEKIFFSALGAISDLAGDLLPMAAIELIGKIRADKKLTASFLLNLSIYLANDPPFSTVEDLIVDALQVEVAAIRSLQPANKKQILKLLLQHTRAAAEELYLETRAIMVKEMGGPYKKAKRKASGHPRTRTPDNILTGNISDR